MMRKNCGSKLVKRIGNITSDCYMQAVNHTIEQLDLSMFDVGPLIALMRTTSEVLPYYELPAGVDVDLIIKAKNLTDGIYLDKLKELPTKTIEDILFVHERGRIKRAQRTIETLLQELARRTLLGDSSESDSKIGSKGVTNARQIGRAHV